MTGRGTHDVLISTAVDSLRSGRPVPSLQHLARAAGLTTGAVYSQFGNRALLLLEVAFAEGASAIVSAVDEAGAFSRLNEAMPAGAPLDPLVAAMVEAAKEPLARARAVQLIDDLCSGDSVRRGRLAIGLSHALLVSVAVSPPSRSDLRRTLRQTT